MGTIPPVPSCEDLPESWDDPGLISVGLALMVTEKDTFTPRNLDGQGIPLVDGQGVHLATGEINNPLKLPLLQTLKEGSTFPHILLMNKSGVFYRLIANQTSERFVISSKNGSFVLEKLLSEPCFKDEDICDNCTPDHIAGFKVDEETGKTCLIKLPLSVTTDFWESSDCIEITGSGTEEDPYIPSIIISPDEGNLLQCTENGLFVAQESS